MKPRTLLVLALLVAGLGAFIWFYERDLPSSEERGVRARKLLGGLEGDQVVAVEIDAPQGRVRLERAVPEPAPDDPGSDAADSADEPLAPGPEPEWRIAEPAALAGARADRFAVERLVDRLTGLDKERTFDHPDRAELGLDEPRGRITLVAEDGEETTLELGAEVPASTSSLVGIAGRPEAWVVAARLEAEIAKKPGEWRDTEVFPLRRDQVERLALVPFGSGLRVLLVRRGETFWLEEPVVDRAETEEVEGLLTDLVGLRATRFVDDPDGDPDGDSDGDPVDRGLDPPRGTIEAWSADGESLRLELGAAEDGSGAAPAASGSYYARIGPQVFTASTPLLDRVDQPIREWQSRSLSGRRLYQIDRVRIEQPGAEAGLALRRDGADWRRGEEAIPYSAVSDLLFAVTDARAESLARPGMELVGGPALELDSPTLSLTFEGADEPEAETISLYPPAASGEIPATVTGRELVLLLAPSTAETLSDAVRRLREVEPIPEDEAAVDDGLAIEVEEGGEG